MNPKSFKKETSKKHIAEINKPEKVVQVNKYFDLFGLIIIILLGIIIYSNSFSCSFHFDDNTSIVDNLAIRNLSDVNAWWHFSPNRPVGIFTYALNYHFNQLDVRYWHLVNVLIHLINACLVWWLTLLIFTTPAVKDHPVARYKKELALITAMLFVSHPLATQSVTYIVQRVTSLVTMFYFISITLFVVARISKKGNAFKFLLFSGSLIAALLAMLTKENAFTLPFTILLVEIFFLRTKKFSINVKDYRLILFLVAFLAVILIIPLKYSFNVLKPIPPSIGHTYALTPVSYLLTEFCVIVRYIWLLFIPLNQNLDYDFPVSESFFSNGTFLCFLLLLSLGILAVFLFKRNRIISFGIFWFFLTLSVESGFIPINDVIFEHRTYLPSYGFSLILSTTLYILFRDKYKFLAISILAIIAAWYSYLTYERNKVWKDDLTLWNDNVMKSPHIARPVTNRGVAYTALGQWDKAIADYSTAIKINPGYMDAWFGRGFVYSHAGRYDKAIADDTRALELTPNQPKVYFNRGIAYGNLGQWDKAIADYSTAIGIDSNYSQALYNRGVCYATLEQWDKAIADYSRSVRIDPKQPLVYSNLGVAYIKTGLPEKAIADFSVAIALDPHFARAYSNLGLTYGNLGQWEKAIANYDMAIQNDPNFANDYYNRGYAYNNLGQWDKAIADFSMAIRINAAYAKAYFNRGVAYGNLGQWDKAIADYASALGIDPQFKAAYSNLELAQKKSK